MRGELDTQSDMVNLQSCFASASFETPCLPSKAVVGPVISSIPMPQQHRSPKTLAMPLNAKAILSHSYPGRCNMNLVLLSTELSPDLHHSASLLSSVASPQPSWGQDTNVLHSFPAPAVHYLQLCREKDTKELHFFSSTLLEAV